MSQMPYFKLYFFQPNILKYNNQFEDSTFDILIDKEKKTELSQRVFKVPVYILYKLVYFLITHVQNKTLEVPSV